MSNVIHIGPGGPATTAVSRGRQSSTCGHRSVSVDQHERIVECANCGVAMDPFSVLLDYARGEREYHHWATKVQTQQNAMGKLLDEEKRVKARMKRASRKDADAAVMAERVKWQERLDRIVSNANLISELAGKVERAAGSEQAKRCGKCRGRGVVGSLWGGEQKACPKCPPRPRGVRAMSYSP